MDRTVELFLPIASLAILILAGLGLLSVGSSLLRGYQGQPQSEGFASALRTLVATGIAVFGVLLLVELVVNVSPDFVIRAAEEHFLAVIGAPMAAVAALFLVLVLRATSGPLEFELAGMKAKGSAGPLLFWVLSFLAMVVAMKLLW